MSGVPQSTVTGQQVYVGVKVKKAVDPSSCPIVFVTVIVVLLVIDVDVSLATAWAHE